MLSLALAAIETDAAPVVAQPFGWLFGSSHTRRAPRPRRRGPAPAAEIPLPVPRPHFSGDSPSETPLPPTPAPPKPAPPAPAPAEAAPGAPAVPLPPEKPAEIAHPGAAAPPPGAPPAAEPSSKPESSKPESSKPGPSKAEPEPAKPQPPKAEPAKPAPQTSEPTAPMSGAAPLGPPPPPATPLPPEKPPELQKPAAAPTVAPSGARLGETPGQPAEDAGCPGRLKARDVDFETIDIGPQPDPRCTVVQPVRLSGLTLSDGTKVSFPEKPRIACTTADAFSLYIRDLLAPLAKGTYGATVTSVWTGPGLECRSRDHIFGAKLSAHGQGLAVDIAQLKLADGRMFEVGQPKAPADQGFETASRAGACGYFHTVLGPGSDSYHRTHWHFDLEVRGAKGDTKYCH